MCGYSAILAELRTRSVEMTQTPATLRRIPGKHRIGLRDYDSDCFWNELLDRSGDEILADIERCGIGDGPFYERLAAATLIKSLGDLVDLSLVRTRFPCGGGFGDIELPICLELLSGPKYRLWERWQIMFRVKSIMVECKNMRRRAGVGEVAQLLTYMVTARRGRLGMLVSRSGFSKNALHRLARIADGDEYLILPLDGEDLQHLATKDRRNAREVMTFFRQKENMLVRAA